MLLNLFPALPQLINTRFKRRNIYPAGSFYSLYNAQRGELAAFALRFFRQLIRDLPENFPYYVVNERFWLHTQVHTSVDVYFKSELFAINYLQRMRHSSWYRFTKPVAGAWKVTHFDLRLLFSPSSG